MTTFSHAFPAHRRWIPWLLMVVGLLFGLTSAQAEIRRLRLTGIVPAQVQPSPLPPNTIVGHYQEIIEGDRFEAILVYDDAIEDINGVTWASLGGYGEYPGALKKIEITFFSPQGVRRDIGAYAYEGSVLIMDRFTGAPYIPHQPAGGDYTRLTFAGGRKVGLAPMPIRDRHFLAGLILPGMSSIDVTFLHEERHVFSGKVEGPSLQDGLTLGHALQTSQPGQTLEILNYLLHDPTHRTDDTRGRSTITLSLLSQNPESPEAFLVKQTVLSIQAVAEVPGIPTTPSCPQIRPRGFVSPVLPEGQKEFELIIPAAPPAGESITVPLAVFPPGILTAPVAVTFQAGERRKLFTVEIQPGNGGSSVTLRAGTADCYGLFTLGLEQVEPPKAVKLEFFPAETDGGRPVLGLVTFDRPAGVDGGPEFHVRFSPDEPGAPPSVSSRLPAGARGAFFNVQTTTRPQTTTYTGELLVGESETHLRATLTVLAPEPSALLDRLTVSPAGVRETESTLATVFLLHPAPDGGVELALSASSTDVTLPASVTVPAGRNSVSFNVTTKDVDTVTLVELGARLGSEAVFTRLTVFPDAPRPVLLSLTVAPRKVTDAATAIGTLTISAAPVTQPVKVMLKSFSRDLILPDEVEVAFGQTSASFPVATRLVSRETRAVIIATLDGRTSTAVVDLDPSLLPRLQSMTLDDSAPAQGSTVTARVQLDRLAPAGGSFVTLAGRPMGTLGLPASVTVPAGESVATFPVNVEADPLGESHMVTLEATLGNLTLVRRFLAVGTDLAQRATYTAFAAELFPGQGNNPLVAGPDVIAPGQTLNNAQRYAFGSSGALNSVRANSTAGGLPALQFRFPWRVDAVDLRLILEASSDLHRWEEVPGEQVGLSIRGISGDGRFYTLEALVPQFQDDATAAFRVRTETMATPGAP